MSYIDLPLDHWYTSDLLMYLHDELGDGHPKKRDYVANLLSWLSTTPRYTVYRVNMMTHESKEIQDIICNQFSKMSTQEKTNPVVFVHPLMSEVIVVDSWNLTSLNLRYQEKEVVVDTACGIAVLRGAHVFAPGVKGMFSNTLPGDYVSVYADIETKCTRGLTALFTRRKYFIGNGIVKIGRNDLFQKNASVKGIAVEMTDIRSGVPSLPLNCIPSSHALLQNLPSVLTCRILNPCQGEKVLDMCAAPGNKTTHLAMLMNNKGIIVAVDKTDTKIKTIRDKLSQFGITCVKCYVYDSTKAVKKVLKNKGEELNALQTDESVHIDSDNVEDIDTEASNNDLIEGPPFLCESFDRILLDAPCSAIGQRPQINYTSSLKQLKSYPPLQRNLFQSAVALLKPGGHLVYSTCTVTVSENECIVKWALEKFPCLHLEQIEFPIGGPGLENVGLTNQQVLCVRRFGPPINSVDLYCEDYSFNHDTVGFFIAHFVKKANE